MSGGDQHTLTIECLDCLSKFDVAAPDRWVPGTVCPSCGGPTRAMHALTFTAQARGKASVSYEGRDAIGRKFAKGRTAYEPTRDGSLAGTDAHVEQHTDSRAKRYRKKVTLSDGTVIKDVDGDLRDQSLHGPQSPMP